MPVPTPDETFLTACLAIARGLMAYHRYEVHGLENVPKEGAALIPCSHSLATYDSILLGAAIFLGTGRYPAGLADRRVFQTPGLAKIFDKLGAVEGTPDAGLRFLQSGHLLMLAPGGMREALRPSNRRYQVSWENRLGFARLAIRAQAPVILAACPASDDIFTLYDNPITPWVYRRFKWPLPFFRGLGLTWVPRPVKLVHYLSAPIPPPPFEGPEPDEAVVKKFQARLTREMSRLMKRAA